MDQSLEIMKLEPTASTERRLATVWLTRDGVVRVEPEDGGNDRAYWIRLLTEVSSIDPSADPAGFFAEIPASLDGTYVYVRPGAAGSRPVSGGSHSATTQAVPGPADAA
jgi:hypothetical protein